MNTLDILEGTQRTADGHLIGVLAAQAGDGGSGRARIGVRCGESSEVERFTVQEHASVVLADGWTLRVVHVRHSPSASRPIVTIVLHGGDEVSPE